MLCAYINKQNREQRNIIQTLTELRDNYERSKRYIFFQSNQALLGATYEQSLKEKYRVLTAL